MITCFQTVKRTCKITCCRAVEYQKFNESYILEYGVGTDDNYFLLLLDIIMHWHHDLSWRDYSASDGLRFVPRATSVA